MTTTLNASIFSMGGVEKCPFEFRNTYSFGTSSFVLEGAYARKSPPALSKGILDRRKVIMSAAELLGAHAKIRAAGFR